MPIIHTVYAEPEDFDRDRLASVLRSRWELAFDSLRYEPVGFGTHHYVAELDGRPQWFVNVDDVVTKSWIASDPSRTLEALDRAMSTVIALRASGLDFIHAPSETTDGDALVAMDKRYAVSLFAYVPGRSNDFGKFASDEQRRSVLTCLGRLHASNPGLAEGLRTDTLEVPQRDELFATLADLSRPWNSGPYGDKTRELLVPKIDGIRAMFVRYDALVPAVRAGREHWVITHGEPHGSNLIESDDGTLVLIDWDTVAIGPKERDLWMVEPQDDVDLAAYTSGGGSPDIDRDAIELYNLWWALSEITGYVSTFRNVHSDDANTQVAWRELQTYLPD